MSTNILDLQRLPDSNVLSFMGGLSADDASGSCTLCSVTCSSTAAQE